MNWGALAGGSKAVTTPSGTSGFWYGFSHFVMRHPVPLAALSAALLIALGLPFAGIRFNSVDQTALPASSDARQVSDTLIREYGAPSTASLNVVVEAPASDGAEVQGVRQQPAIDDRCHAGRSAAAGGQRHVEVRRPDEGRELRFGHSGAGA